MDHWKDILDGKYFAKNHYNYIVTLNYVEEVTKDFVALRYGSDEYKVDTLPMKIGAFKKAELEFDR